MDILKKSSFSPIALFVYNRLTHTISTVEALALNAEAIHSDLIVFSDGPRDEADAKLVKDLRDFLKTVVGFKSVRVVVQEKNIGLAESIINGVTQVLESSETVIVLEDDLVSSRYFLNFMNTALEKYKNESQVASILGYCLPVKGKLPETYFMRGADCWGWATWRRSWQYFERDGKKLLSQLEEQQLEYGFELEGSVPYMQMLRDQIEGRNNSWAIRWRTSLHLKNLLSLYPGRSLIQNIGFDGSGTHCPPSNVYYVKLADSPIRLDDISIEINHKVVKRVIRFYRSLKITFSKRVINFLKKRIKIYFRG